MKKYLQKLLWKYALRLTSAFNTPSLLKSRIVMLYQKPSARVAVAKFGFVLPTLMLCMLITAFTQRERVLPKALTTEVNKVAQRLATEMQNAFLPAPIAQEEKEEKPKEALEVGKETADSPTETQEKPSLLTLPAGETTESSKKTPDFVSLVPAQTIPQETTTNRSIDTDDYTFLKRYYLSPEKTSQRFSYIFTKNNEYFFQVIDAKSKAPITGANIKVSVFAKRDKELLPMAVEKTAQGWFFQCEATGLFELVFENPDKMDCLAVELSFHSGFKTVSSKPKTTDTDVFLADMAGKEINFKKKIAVKKGLQLLFADAETNKHNQIKKVVVTQFRKGKAINSKTFEDKFLSFQDFKVTRGDAIQITVSEVIDAKTNQSIKIARPYISFFAK